MSVPGVAIAVAYSMRRMEEKDIAAIMEVERLAYEFPWTVGIFRDCIRSGYCCRVAENNGLPVAYAVMSVGAREAHMLNLCVRPELQNKGYGRAILADMMDLARRLRADILFLEVRPSNLAARALYERLGFNELATRTGYYPTHRGREDALILARHL